MILLNKTQVMIRIHPMKIKYLISWILQFVVAAIMAYAAWGKLSSVDTAVVVFTALEMEPSGRYVIGCLEAMVALLLLLPWSIALGAVLGWGVMTGALIAHATHLGISGEMGMSAAMALFCWLSTSMIAMLRSREVPFLRPILARDNSDSSDPYDPGNTGLD